MGFSPRLEADLLGYAAVTVDPDGGAGGPHGSPAAPVRGGRDRVRSARAVWQRELLNPPVREKTRDLTRADLGNPDGLSRTPSWWK